jgi:hypothetical protein
MPSPPVGFVLNVWKTHSNFRANGREEEKKTDEQVQIEGSKS